MWIQFLHHKAKTLYVMNNETTDILLIAAAIIGVIILGVILIALSRWARIKRAEMDAQGIKSQTYIFRSGVQYGSKIARVHGVFPFESNPV